MKVSNRCLYKAKKINVVFPATGPKINGSVGREIFFFTIFLWINFSRLFIYSVVFILQFSHEVVHLSLFKSLFIKIYVMLFMCI